MCNLFGEESDLYKRIKLEINNVGEAKQQNAIGNPSVLADIRNKFTGLLQAAIETVEHFGVIKDTPWVVRFATKKPELFWSVIVVLVGVISWISVAVGKASADNNYNEVKLENYKLEDENKKLKESIIFLKTTGNTPKHKSNKDTTNNKKEN